MNQPILYFFFIFFFVLELAIAQTGKKEDYIINTQTFTIEDDLSHRRANCFTQDMNGFMWIGTPYGLNRYDGYEFKVYTQKKYNFQGNNIANIISAPDGLLWLIYNRDIKSRNAIDVFDPIEGTAKPIEDYFKKQLPFDINQVDVFNYVENEDKSIWFASKQKIFEYNGKDIHCIATLADSFEIEGFRKTPNNEKKAKVGLGWVHVAGASKQGVSFLYLDEKGKVVDQTPIFSGAKDLYANHILSVLENGALLFYVGNKSKDEKLITTTYQKEIGRPIKEISYSTNKLYRHQRFSPFYQQIWCSGDNGPVDVFDLEGQFIYQFDLGKQFVIFPGASFFDRKGGYWLSYKSEISLTYSDLNLFDQYIYNNEKIGKLGCRGIGEDKHGRLYINGHRGSFYIKNKGEKDQITTLPYPTKFYRNKHLDTALRVALLIDEDNTVWLTDQFHRLLHYLPQENRIDFFTHENVEIAEQFKKGAISMNWTLFKDYKDRIWIGQNAGIAYLDKERALLVKPETYGEFSKLAKSEVFHFYENEEGIWLATTTGLYLANHDMQIVEHFSSTGDKAHYLPYDIIAHLHEDQAGIFWLATKGGGIIKWNPKTKDYQQFTVEEGLSHNVVYSIYEDDYDCLWLSSDMGIIRMNKKNNSFKNYLPKDGVTHEEFNTASHYKASDGTLYFGSLNGVTSFHPKDFLLTKNRNTTKVKISSFIKYNSEREDKQIDLTKKCIEKREINIFDVDRTAILRFSILDYKQPKTILYAYKIEGLDEDWQYTSKPELNLVGLPKGRYILKIKTQDTKVDSLELRLNVHHPIFLQTWFICLWSLFFIVLIHWYIRRREKNLMKQKKHLEMEVASRTKKIQQQTNDLKALDQLKSRLFANVSHELRTPLTLILGPLSVMLKREKDTRKKSNLKTIERNGKHLLQMVDQILDLSKLDANKLELNYQPTDLEIFIKYVFSAFDSEGIFQKIEYRLEYNISEHKTVLVDRDKLQNILNNFLSNAFKFTNENGKIKLRVTSKEKQIRFDVIDTGKGIHPNDLPHVFERFYQTKQNTAIEGGAGIGLAFCKELVDLMDGELLVDSILGVGSTFSLLLNLEDVLVERAARLVEEELNLENENEALNAPIFDAENQLYTVLLVEDNKDMQEYIQGLLIDDYKVIICNNGQIALDYLINKASILPNIIVSDVMMPQMDGFTFLKYCKTNERLCSIPMIMLTARSAMEDRLNALRIGVDDYLIKPFLVDELLVRIKNLLRNAQNRSIVERATELIEEEKPKEELKEVNKISENDLNWIKEVEQIGLEFADDPDFDTEVFAQKVGMSRRNLQRRLKKVTGLTPGQYLRELRLEMARSVLERGVYQTIAEVAYASGFTTPYYFSQIYEKRFGKKVSSYF